MSDEFPNCRNRESRFRRVRVRVDSQVDSDSRLPTRISAVGLPTPDSRLWMRFDLGILVDTHTRVRAHTVTHVHTRNLKLAHGKWAQALRHGVTLDETPRNRDCNWQWQPELAPTLAVAVCDPSPSRMMVPGSGPGPGTARASGPDFLDVGQAPGADVSASLFTS